MLRREIVFLAFLSIVAVLAYWGARTFAASNRRMKAGTAAAWYREGRQRLSQGHPDAAVSAFRNAAANDHTNRVYLLSLARGLLAAGRKDEARELLLRMRESAPEDPEINLDLARIAADQRDVQKAVIYYHNALYGIWTGENVDAQRQKIRGELIEFLISQHAREQGLAEILALAAHLPDTVSADLELGEMFLKAGSPREAAARFQRVLRRRPHDQQALLGAGRAFYQTGDYIRARRALVSVRERDPATQQLLDTATEVTELDPLEPHLSEAERRRRTRAGLRVATEHLKACANRQTDPRQREALELLAANLNRQMPLLSRDALTRKPNLIFSTLGLVLEAEQAISTSCGPLGGTDLALFLVAQKAQGAEP